MRLVVVSVVSMVPTILAACGDDPLTPLSVREGVTDDAADNTDDDDDADDPDDVEEEVTDPPDPTDPVPPVGDGDNTPGGLICADGTTGSSWTDVLPARPLPLAMPPTLLGDVTGPRATCNGGAARRTNVEATEDVESEVRHNTGRFYFEASTEVFEAGWSSVGVFANPSSVSMLPFASAFGGDEWSSSAAVDPPGIGTVSVAADVSAGVIFFYLNGALSGSTPLSRLPGVGAVGGGGVSMSGNQMLFNFGSEPFRFAPPAGFEAWNTDDDGGPCASDADIPVATAPVDGATTSFLADADADPQLIILGTYDTGGVSGWEWGPNGETIDTGNFQRGSVRVQLRRPGNIYLALSAYEPTDWTLEVGDATNLLGVMVRGFHDATIQGVPAGVDVDVLSYCNDGNGGRCMSTNNVSFPVAPYQWPSDDGGGDTPGFVQYAEEEFCTPMTLFAGNYGTQSFVVN
jgi:hypothetical protein